MSDHLQSDEEKITHEYSHRVIDLEIRKHHELLETIKDNNKFKWSVFLSSFLFVLFIYAVLILSHAENQNLFIEVVVVNFGFNFIFTLGFSQALMHSMVFPYLVNMHLNPETHHRDAKMFSLNMVAGGVLSFLASLFLFHFWVRAEYVSSILDSTLLAVIFIHMVRGLNHRHTCRQLIKIRNEYNEEMLSVINEHDKWKNINDSDNIVGEK